MNSSFNQIEPGASSDETELDLLIEEVNKKLSFVENLETQSKWIEKTIAASTLSTDLVQHSQINIDNLEKKIDLSSVNDETIWKDVKMTSISHQKMVDDSQKLKTTLQQIVEKYNLLTKSILSFETWKNTNCTCFLSETRNWNVLSIKSSNLPQLNTLVTEAAVKHDEFSGELKKILSSVQSLPETITKFNTELGQSYKTFVANIHNGRNSAAVTIARGMQTLIEDTIKNMNAAMGSLTGGEKYLLNLDTLRSTLLYEISKYM